jgi:hypothetical protein
MFQAELQTIIVEENAVVDCEIGVEYVIFLSQDEKELAGLVIALHSQ